MRADNVDGPRGGRLTHVGDFYRPTEIVRRGLDHGWIYNA